MITVNELREEAIRARDEHGNTDMFHVLNQAADTIEELCRLLDGTINVAREALRKCPSGT